ncbi:MAG TPA: hypothetical protein VFB50_01145 [Chloroflexota bacterium]|nr:hypothetical protein [Chloroflexota bacterium]
MATPSSNDLASFIDQFSGAVASGNTQSLQESIREFNLKYANDVAQLYGQNWGPGNPAPIGASTLAQGQTFGSIGYIPGYTGQDASQLMGLMSAQASTAQNAAGLTGFYAPPSQSQWTPGTFLRMDPGTYDTGQYGTVQLDYVLPTGQLQRVSIPQAKAMGWNGDLSSMNTVPMATAVTLERAAPQQLPQQTLQGLTAYSNLNTAAQNQALAQAGVTGMYQAPATVSPPGTALDGSKFADLPQATQQAYYASNGSDWSAAMAAWTAAANAQIRQAYAAKGLPLPGTAGAPQETLQAQQQYFTQAQDLANAYGQYYTPGAPGQTAQAGVNVPQQGQLTLANINQQNAIKQAWASQYGYVPQFDANGQPIFQAGANGNPQWTLAAQQQAYAQQLGAINAAAALQANPFRQQQVIGQLGRVLTGQGVAGFSAPNTIAGVGTAGGTGPNTGFAYMNQLISDIQNPGANQSSVQSVLDAIPTPNKINS